MAISIRQQIMGMSMITVGLTGVVLTVLAVGLPQSTTSKASGDQVRSRYEQAYQEQYAYNNPLEEMNLPQNAAAVREGGGFEEGVGEKVGVGRTYSLQAGNNSVGFDVDTSLSASKLCMRAKEIQSVTEFDRATQAWAEHTCNEATNDFNLEPFSGYFLQVSSAIDLRVSGKLVSYDYDVQEGWNFLMIEGAESGQLTAGNVCGYLGDTGMQVVEIDRWYNGGWDPHMCELPFNNFEIEPLVGYMIRVEAGQPTASTVPMM